MTEVAAETSSIGKEGQEEFTTELVRRGILKPPGPSLHKRAKRILTAPLRLLSAVVGWVTWCLWGRVQYEMAVRKGIERWRQLAGIGVVHSHMVIDQERVRLINESYDHAQALAIHDNVIKNKIVPPPAPEIDDTGLEQALQRGWPVSAGESVVPPRKCAGLEFAGMHRGSPCQYCGEQLVAPDGQAVTFPAP